MSILSPNLVVVVSTVLVSGFILFFRPIANASWWRAMVTPLASIMGSGFLVCAPLLYSSIGNYAVWAMAALLLLAYGVGAVIRFNIRYGEELFQKKEPIVPDESDHRLHRSHNCASGIVAWSSLVGSIEKSSHVILVLAYFISVSYYLQLLAGFALNNIIAGHPWVGKLVVTLLLVGIGVMGTAKGLKGVERMEKTVVGFNLGMIAALIAGLVFYNVTASMAGTWALKPLPITDSPLHLTRIIMGLLIVVQGFETSRFLSSEHSKDERIRTMRWAQIVSSVIYIAFLSLMALVMSNSSPNSEDGITAIVALSGAVAPLLPFLLTITAICSQFSAATADDAGCAGLLEGMMGKVIPKRYNYLVVSSVAITLTWLTDVYQIISYASRAFALYYALQCLVALLVMRKTDAVAPSRVKAIVFAMLGIFCLAVAIFGIPAG